MFSAFVRWGCGSLAFLVASEMRLFLKFNLLGAVVGPCLVLEW